MNLPSSWVDEITGRHAELTRRWHEAPTDLSAEMPWSAIERNHRMNFDLWHAEDIARRDDLGLESIREAKRLIDRSNQARVDAIEQLDVWLLGQLPAGGAAPLHSETPGMLVDRLSILALKIYHMAIEAERATATAEHRAKCAQKSAILQEQLGDMRECLRSLLLELQAGTRRFKLYRQLKMYNDAATNPQLYERSSTAKR